MKRLCAVLIVVLVAGSMGLTPVAAQQAGDRYQCDDIELYAMLFYSAIPYDNDAMFKLFDQDIESLSRSEARSAASALEDWATALKRIDEYDIPWVASDFHEAMIDYLEADADLLSGYANAGERGARPYISKALAASAELMKADRLATRRCGIQWTENISFSD